MKAIIGDDVQLTVDNLTLIADQGRIGSKDYTGLAEGYGVEAAAILGIQATQISSRDSSDVRAIIGNNGQFLVTEDMDLTADLESEQFAGVDGGQGAGFYSGGSNLAEVFNDNVVLASLGTATVVRAGALRMNARGTDDMKAKAETGSAAFVGTFGASDGNIFAAKASADSKSNTQTVIGNNAGIIVD